MPTNNDLFDPVRLHHLFRDKTIPTYNSDAARNFYKNTYVLAGHLRVVIDAWILGLHQNIEPFMGYFLTRMAPEESENKNSDPWNQMRILEAKAIALWMLDNENHSQLWEKVGQLNISTASIQNTWSKGAVAAERLDGCMAYFVQSGQYEMGIAEFEKYHSNKAISLKKALKPRHLGYAYCLHKAKQQFDEEELFQAGRKLLQYYLEGKWLYGGYDGSSVNAAMWLKIIYWHRDPTLTPLQTLLKAYENMPHVPVPDFIDLNAK